MMAPVAAVWNQEAADGHVGHGRTPAGQTLTVSPVALER